jgi:hypothetical protein
MNSVDKIGQSEVKGIETAQAYFATYIRATEESKTYSNVFGNPIHDERIISLLNDSVKMIQDRMYNSSQSVYDKTQDEIIIQNAKGIAINSGAIKENKAAIADNAYDIKHGKGGGELTFNHFSVKKPRVALNSDKKVLMNDTKAKPVADSNYMLVLEESKNINYVFAVNNAGAMRVGVIESSGLVDWITPAVIGHKNMIAALKKDPHDNTSYTKRVLKMLIKKWNSTVVAKNRPFEITLSK